MVGFHNATRADTTVSNWWTDGANVIAFSRGPATAAMAGSRSTTARRRCPTTSFSTGMAAGTYCDIIHGDVSGGACTGPTVTVASGGTATCPVAVEGRGRDRRQQPGHRRESVPDTVAQRATSSTVNVTFSVSGAPTGNPVYLVGSVTSLGSWARPVRSR